MMKKKLVIFTYYWPPSGGPAVQRWLAFSNLLIGHNVEITVITPHPENATYPFLDHKLVNDIHEKIKVIQIPSKDSFYLYKKLIGRGKVPSSGFINEKNSLTQRIARFIRGNFYFPDPRKNWLKQALKEASHLIQSENYTNIITAGPPHSTHFVGLKLKKKYPNINWICDFHDAWTDIWFYDKLLKTNLAKLIDKKMEKLILDRADHVLTVGEFLKLKLIETTTLKNESKFHLISMGYDKDIDYSEIKTEGNPFTISYTGTIDHQYHAEIIFEALGRLKKKQIDIQLRFVGLVSDNLKKLVKVKNLEDVVLFFDYVPHHESIEYLRSSDCLLLVSPDVKSEQLIIPGKIYEYLATKKTIINIGDVRSNTAQIITECNAGINIDRNEIDKLTEFLLNYITNWDSNKDYSPYKSNLVHEKYSRKEEVKKINKLLISNRIKK